MISTNVPTFRKNLRKSGSRHRAKARSSGPNLKLQIEYDGTNYCGWQIQKPPNSRLSTPDSIQETIEKTLQQILQEKVKLIASGRTDAGVHALAQIANFQTKSAIPLKKLQLALNGLLPEDIVITGITKVNPGFHSRFWAKSKIYRYLILNRPYPSALLRKQVYFYPYPLKAKLMQKEAKALIGKHDFRAFQGADKKERSAVRVIKKIRIAKFKDMIYIDIEANGFLKNMVRAIVGTLIEIGRGRFSAGSTKKILFSKNRRFSGPTAPAKGLTLMKVRY